MKVILTQIFCSGVIALSYSERLVAADKPLAIEGIQCTKEELGTFFPKVVVKAVLLKNNVSEAQADDIAAGLEHKDDMLIKIIEDKAAKLDPNPLQDRNQRDVGIKIYRETLFQEFSKVLKAHGITDVDQTQKLLDEIQRTKSKLFIDCVRKKIPQSQLQN
jgi:hypothetical protein